MSPKKRRKPSPKTNYTPVILVALFVFVLIAAGGLAWVLVKRDREDGTRDDRSDSGTPATPELAAAIAETDAADPNWRLADLVKARVKPADEQNATRLALSAARQIPDGALKNLNAEQRRDPSAPVPEAELQQFRSVVRSCAPALGEARGMVDFTAGQFEINFDFARPLEVKLKPEQDAYRTAGLLWCDSRTRAAEGDAPGAVRAAAALLVLARCYNDELALIGFLVKGGIGFRAVDALEQALTCAAVSDHDLQALQWLLEAKAAETPVLALRGERAMRHATIEAKTFTGGDVSPSSHAWVLRTLNRAIELTIKGVPYDSSEWSSYLDAIKNGPPEALRSKIMPALDQIRDAAARRSATLRTAAVGVAAERYRRATGSWPTDLKQLAPAYISSLPADPYTGSPILSAQTAQGFSVYVKARAAFASGEFAAIGKPDGCQGFRLLNPNRRRAATGK